MLININGVVQRCNKCNSDDLDVLTIKTSGISNENNSFVIWCNRCETETLEDKINLTDVKGINFWIDN